MRSIFQGILVAIFMLSAVMAGRKKQDSNNGAPPSLVDHLLQLAREHSTEYNTNNEESLKQHDAYKKLSLEKDSRGNYLDHRHPQRLMLFNAAQESGNAAAVARLKYKHIAEIIESFKRRHPGQTTQGIESLPPSPRGSQNSQMSARTQQNTPGEGTGRSPKRSSQRRKHRTEGQSEGATDSKRFRG